MSILFFISTLNFGGAEKQAVTDANMLSEEHKVFLISFLGSTLKKQLNEKVNYLFIKKGNYIITAYRLARLVKKNDIQIIHSSLFAPIIISALAGFFTRVNVIWSFHSHEYDIPLKSKLTYRFFAHLPWIKRILFVNTELKKFLAKRFNLPKAKTGILYNSTNFAINNTIIKEPGDVFNIGYIGRLVKLKRVHYLIELVVYLLQNKRN